MQYVQFQPFTRRGYLLNFDGEIFARKGLASARILFHDLTVDVFTSHFASYRDDPRTNSVVRRLQTLETAEAIALSDADAKVFGGDINALPAATFPGMPYNIFTSVMVDACAERFAFGVGGARMHPVFDTYGNRPVSVPPKNWGSLAWLAVADQTNTDCLNQGCKSSFLK